MTEAAGIGSAAEQAREMARTQEERFAAMAAGFELLSLTEKDNFLKFSYGKTAREWRFRITDPEYRK